MDFQVCRSLKYEVQYHLKYALIVCMDFHLFSLREETGDVYKQRYMACRNGGVRVE